MYTVSVSTHTKYEALEICLDCNHLLLTATAIKYHNNKYKSESKCIRTEGFLTRFMNSGNTSQLCCCISITPHEFDDDYYAFFCG